MLHPDTILQKSEAARQLMKAHGNHQLSVRLRAVLILINGERTLGDVQQALHTWTDVAQLCEQLLAEKMVLVQFQPTPSPAPTPSSRPSAKAEQIKVYLINQAKSIFGEAARPVLDILEKTPTETHALANAVVQCNQLATMTIDEAKARAFIQSARALRKPNSAQAHAMH